MTLDKEGVLRWGNTVLASDANTWSFGRTKRSPAIAGGGSLLLVPWINSLRCYDRQGKMVWETELEMPPAKPYESPGGFDLWLQERNSTIAAVSVSTSDFWLLSLDGTVLWHRCRKQGASDTHPAFSPNGNIYTTDLSGRIYCYSSSGQELWVNSSYWDHGRDVGPNFWSDLCVGDNSEIYIITATGLTCLSADGEVQWLWSGNRPEEAVDYQVADIYCLGLLQDDTLVVQVRQGNPWPVEKHWLGHISKTGKLLSTYALEDSATGLAITSDNCLIVGLDNGYALQLSAEWKKEWELKLIDASVSFAGVDDAGKYYFRVFNRTTQQYEPTVVLSSKH